MGKQTEDFNALTRETSEHSIYSLRRKADLLLLAGDIEGFNRLQTTIVELQRTTGAVKGAERKPDNASRTA